MSCMVVAWKFYSSCLGDHHHASADARRLAAQLGVGLSATRREAAASKGVGVEQLPPGQCRRLFAGLEAIPIRLAICGRQGQSRNDAGFAAAVGVAGGGCDPLKPVRGDPQGGPWPRLPAGADRTAHAPRPWSGIALGRGTGRRRSAKQPHLDRPGSAAGRAAGAACAGGPPARRILFCAGTCGHAPRGTIIFPPGINAMPRARLPRRARNVHS